MTTQFMYTHIHSILEKADTFILVHMYMSDFVLYLLIKLSKMVATAANKIQLFF